MADAPQGDFLVLSGISKRYGGVRALENVDFALRARHHPRRPGRERRRQVDADQDHRGRRPAGRGRDALDGRARQFASPSAATAAGIVCIFQELSLMPDLSVADNISIATPPRRFGMIDARAQRRRAEALLAEVGCEDINPLLRVRDLPLSRRQMVEIAKALGQKPASAHPRRGDLGADQRRRREGLHAPGAAQGARTSPSSTSRIACTRSRRWPTAPRCSATAATSRPSTRASVRPPRSCS